MRSSLGRLFHIGTQAHVTPPAGFPDLAARLHYKNDPDVEEIEAFKIGGGISFFLTFIGGGTIAIDLTDVREIRFVGVADCKKRSEADAPIHEIRVWMNNGRILEGISADLHSFSGRKSGEVWHYSSAPEVSRERELSRVEMRDAHHWQRPS